MKKTDCKHYDKGWCLERKGINADYTKNPPVKKFVRIRCSEVHTICGGCEYYTSKTEKDEEE